MKLKTTRIKDVKILKSKIYYDNRGYFKEVFKKNLFRNQNFKFDCISFSKKNVLRGLHIQLSNSQDKLITVLKGKIFDVAVDLRINSKTFGKHISIILSDKSETSLFIPKGFAHGFMCLSKNCIVSYKLTSYQNKKSERTINWFDKDLNIKWPKKKPITSKKDALGLSFEEIKKILK
jgi:dTDP-4-dehydrorhamnose 3,5-epimerase